MDHIPLSKITPDPANVRAIAAGKDADAQLVASMKAIGLLSPIHVQALDDERFQVVAGHRRFAAAKKLKWTEIPAIVVKAGASITLIQASENMVRADMNPLDTWVAIDRMLVEGMTPAAVAAALNLPEREVHRYRAMGSLEPTILAAIRKQPDRMPAAREIKLICQATHAEQVAAFKQTGSDWYRLAAALQMVGMPRSHARFDLAKYTGAIHRDLFNDDADELLLDAAQALRLQEEWAQGERERAISNGFQAAVLAVDQWNSVKTPAGGQPDTWHWKDAKKGWAIKRADRDKWIYASLVRSDGQLVERFVPVKEKAAAKAGTAAVAEPLSKKGLDLVDLTKREAVVEALDKANDHQLMLVAAVLLMELHNAQAVDHGVLFEKGGALRWPPGVPIDNLLASVLQAAIIKHRFGAQIGMGVVERVGEVLSAFPTLDPTADTLAMAKRAGLSSILKGLGKTLGDFSTQAKAREFIAKEMGNADRRIDLTFLPALAWDTSRPLDYHWSVPAPNGAAHDDEDEGDEAEEAA